MRERSLAGLVETAVSRCRGDVAELAREIARLAGVGLFDHARRLTRLSELRLEFLAELSGMSVESLIEMRDRDAAEWDRFSEFHGAVAYALEEEPCWRALSAACELADRVDHFLAHYDQATESASLAQDCRADTTLLGILADWLTERQQLRASEEARHLRNLCDAAAHALPPGDPIAYSDYFLDVDLE